MAKMQTRIDMLRKLLTRTAGIAAAVGIAVGGPAVAQEQEIVIGAPNSLTGGFGEGGRHVVNGLEMAVDEINAAGGIAALGGAKLRVAPADTSSDNPSQAASVTRRLITQEGATVLVGAHTSTMTLSAQIEAERAEVPLITTSYADQIVERGYEYTFKIPPQASRFSVAGLEYTQEIFAQNNKPLENIAIFYGTDAASQAGGEAYLKLAAEQDIEVVTTGSFPSGLTDPTPVLAPILQHKPDVIFLNAFTSDVILITRALRSVGVTTPIVGSGSGISAPTIGEALGEQANGLMGTLAWNGDLPVPGVEAFSKAFLDRYPNEQFAPQEAGEGYAIGHLIALAIENAGSNDPKMIREALSAIDAPAMLPGNRVEFDDNGLNKHIMPIMVSWYNGELRTVWPKQYQTIEPPLD